MLGLVPHAHGNKNSIKPGRVEIIFPFDFTTLSLHEKGKRKLREDRGKKCSAPIHIPSSTEKYKSSFSPQNAFKRKHAE